MGIDHVRDPQRASTGGTATATTADERASPDEALASPGPQAFPWAEMFAATPLALAVNDPAARNILWANAEYARLHGYEPAEVIGKPVLAMYAPGARSELQGHQARTAAERALTFRASHLRKDGSTFPARVDARAMTDASGEVRYWVVTVEDLTDAEATADSRARLAAIVESTQDAIVGAALDGTLTTWNAAAERLFGWSAAEAIGQPLTMLMPPEHREERVVLPRIAAGERVEPYETVRVCKDGTRLHVLLSVSPVRDAAGRIVGAAGIVRDLTAQKEAEQAERFLADASARLAQSLDADTSVRSLAELAVATMADGCLVTLRDEAAEWRGEYPFVHVAVASRVPGRGELVLETERRFPLAVDAPSGYPRAIRTGEAELVPRGAFEEAVLPGVAQSPAHLELLRQMQMRSAVITPLVARGRTLGAITLVRHGPDRRPAFITRDLRVAEELGRRAGLALDNVRLLEAERRARAEAERANRAKSNFLATMSHELRTPLNAIAGYVQLMELGLRGPVTAEQQADLERIRRSQQHLLSLIDEVLSFARIETGRAEFRIGAVDVGTLFEDVMAMAAPLASHRGLCLEHVPPAPGTTALADADKLRQVLVNLVGNAIKFTPQGGRVALSAAGDDDTVVLVVRDTGPGIAREQQEAIFEPFVQVGRTLHNAIEGVGLGLAISREYARAMGGDVTVASAPGEGAAFTVTLARAT